MDHPISLIDRYPRLLAVLASPHPFLNIVFAIPLFYFFWTLPDFDFQAEKAQFAFGLVLGLVYWSLIEYSIHRWIYHGRYRHPGIKRWVEAFHVYHHQNLEDRRVLTAGPLMIYGLAALLLAPIYYLTLSMPTFFSGLGTGVMFYYLFYEWVHYSIHRRDTTSKYMKWITVYHMEHHKKWNTKFGNTTSIWDRIFGTDGT